MHEHLAHVYDASGIEVIHLPAVPAPERVAIVRHANDSMVQMQSAEPLIIDAS